MKPINIFLLTRISASDALSRLDRQMSGREKLLKIKEWEMQGLQKFSDTLSERMENAQDLCFYYSFVMPRLGKEFDLLRVSENSVINIELKSGNITEEAIRRQLLKNRYYLTALGKEIHSYTYISNEDRLVKLTNSEKIQDADWSQLIQNLNAQINCYTDDIELLFKEDQYLISPVSDPERFLRREYFLTSQQNDIKKRILKNIYQKPCSIQGFTGLPGTGKSILLYDIAMELSRKKKVCIIHIGTWPEQLALLNRRLKRVDFYFCESGDEIRIKEKYDAILVDEGHWMSDSNLREIRRYANEENVPVIIAYDKEDVLSTKERPEKVIQEMESYEGFVRYQLTNRIRMNTELSSFVHHVMKKENHAYRRSYPSVQLAYANTEKEASLLLRYFVKNGYSYIYNPGLRHNITIGEQDIDICMARCVEYDRVVMLMDESLGYNSYGELCTENRKETEVYVARNMYHGLNRAKKGIAIVVLKNEPIFNHIVQLL